MAKAILFDIENTLLCPEVPAVQRFAALRLHGEPLFTETTAREAVRQAELWTARQILHELETGTRIRRTLEEAELLPYFSAVTISEEAGVEKPDPRILAMTCEALGVAPAESLYVGDHPFDVLCAERAGMDCAWVDIGLFEPEDLPAQPRWTLRALAELAAVTAL